MPATVYQRVCLKKSEFSRKDLRKIANWINSIYMKNHESEPPKVEQTEGDRSFMVYSYPDELIPIMDNIVDKFFLNKEVTAEKHKQYLLELANPELAKSKEKPKRDDKAPRGNNFKNPAGKGKFDRPKGEFQKKDFGDNKRKDFKTDDRFKKNNDSFVKKTYPTPDKPVVKTEIPVATTFRKRKTAPEAVSHNFNIKKD